MGRVNQQPSKPLRRDAAEHRIKVLDEARKLFALKGLDVPMREIAAAAGLGVGSVYRAVGSKQDLIDLLFGDVVDRALSGLERDEGAATGWAALVRAFRRVLEMQIADRGVYAVLLGAGTTQTERLSESIAPVLSRMVDRAKAEGAVRADLDATDVPTLTRGIAAATDPESVLSRAVAERHLALLLKGLRPVPDDEGPVPPPLPSERFTDWTSTA